MKGASVRRVLVLLTALMCLSVPLAGANAAVDVNAQHQTSAVDDCRFSSWYQISQPLKATATLASAVDGRCSESHQIELDLTVTEGESDATAAPGPANPLLGVSEADPTGLVVSSQRTVVYAPGAQLQASVAAPPAGIVYTVDAIMKFSDACASFGCDPQPVAPGPPTMPGSSALLSNQGMTCVAEHDGTFDVDCEWQFTVVGHSP